MPMSAKEEDKIFGGLWMPKRIRIMSDFLSTATSAWQSTWTSEREQQQRMHARDDDEDQSSHNDNDILIHFWSKVPIFARHLKTKSWGWGTEQSLSTIGAAGTGTTRTYGAGNERCGSGKVLGGGNEEM